MMVYIALCDARWNIRKVIRSIPACLAREGQDAREIFADQDCLDRLMEKSAGGSATQRLKLRGADGRMAFATVKAVKEQVLLLVYEMEDKSQLPQMTEAQLCALDELPGMNTGPYGNEFYEIQKMNNRLVDSKRSLAKANMQLKETLEQIRKAENIIEILERDPITNLLTEKAFYEKADKILKENPDQDFDIIAVDIERFKIVNDAFGTAAGNQLLCDLSACLLDVGGGELSLSARIRQICSLCWRPIKKRGTSRWRTTLENSLTVIHCLPVSKLRQESTGLKNEISLRQECATGHLSQSKALREYFQRGWPTMTIPCAARCLWNRRY